SIKIRLKSKINVAKIRLIYIIRIVPSGMARKSAYFMYLIAEDHRCLISLNYFRFSASEFNTILASSSEQMSGAATMFAPEIANNSIEYCF
ncbi:MAG: hypothetical protein MJK04_05730, partial [Psychrosphaera sp.]|nr:hypothetical protein [Psychrosphaera sp.]